MKKLLHFLIFSTFLFEGFANTIYVDQNAVGANNGLNWANAYNQLYNALNVANQGDTIKVAEGTYKPGPGTNTTVSFNLRENDMVLMGGYGNVQTNPVWNPRLYPTILSGDRNDDDQQNIFTDNTNVIVWIKANNVVIDGFIITGGYNPDANLTGVAGGAAIYKDPVVDFVKVQNCVIRDNYSRDFANVAFAFTNTTQIVRKVMFYRCEFARNKARNGAAIYIDNKNVQLLLNIENCLFHNNVAEDAPNSNPGRAGSSIYAWSEAGGNLDTRIVNCTFSKNQDNGTVSGYTQNNLTTVGLGRNGTGSHTARIYNSIFYENYRNTNIDAFSVGNLHMQRPNVFVFNTTAQFDFSNWTSNLTRNNTTIDNPLFFDFANDNFVLNTMSPCIDAGINSVYATDTTFDLNLNPRKQGAVIDRGAYETTANTTSLAINSSDTELLIYPNPTTDLIYLKSDDLSFAINLYTMDGKKLISSTNEHTIDVSTLVKGAYLLEYISDQKRVTKQILKK